MATKKETGRKVRFRDAAELQGALQGLSQELRLPLGVAMRIALMRQEVDAAIEALESERRKMARDVRAKKVTTGDADDAFATEAAKTFRVTGVIPYRVIADAVGRNGAEPPANLGNILAGLMPVLDGVPDLED